PAQQRVPPGAAVLPAAGAAAPVGPRAGGLVLLLGMLLEVRAAAGDQLPDLVEQRGRARGPALAEGVGVWAAPCALVHDDRLQQVAQLADRRRPLDEQRGVVAQLIGV